MERKDLFTVLGEIGKVKDKDGFDRKRFIPNSPAHLLAVQNRLPLKKKLVCTFAEDVMTFNDGQRDYFFVLTGYLAEHTGYTKNELYVVSIEECFPEECYDKVINGKTHHFRPSISDIGRMSMAKMSKLVDYAYQQCVANDIRVPTKAELGYVEENKELEDVKYPEYNGEPTI